MTTSLTPGCGQRRIVLLRRWTDAVGEMLGFAWTANTEPFDLAGARGADSGEVPDRNRLEQLIAIRRDDDRMKTRREVELLGFALQVMDGTAECDPDQVFWYWGTTPEDEDLVGFGEVLLGDLRDLACPSG